jgi:hypothetical protein
MADLKTRLLGHAYDGPPPKYCPCQQRLTVELDKVVTTPPD